MYHLPHFKKSLLIYFSRTYRAHFLQSEHFNFCGLEENVGPMVLSVKYYTDVENQVNRNAFVVKQPLQITSVPVYIRMSEKTVNLHLALFCLQLSSSQIAIEI